MPNLQDKLEAATEYKLNKAESEWGLNPWLASLIDVLFVAIAVYTVLYVGGFWIIPAGLVGVTSAMELARRLWGAL